MKVRYSFRFYPTSAQAEHLENVFGCVRFVYNWALEYRSSQWRSFKKSTNYNITSQELTLMKQSKPWLKEVSCVPTQQSLRHLQTAFKYDIKNRNLIIYGLGRIDVHWSREFQSYPTTATIIKSSSGKYFVSLCLNEHREHLPKTGKSVGIDLGIKTLAVFSDGTRIENPKFLSSKLKKLAKAQRILSRRQKGSSRRNYQRIKVAKLYEQVTNARKDFLNKLTTSIVREYDFISVENLSVKNMSKNRKLSRAIADAGFYRFRQMLEYKCHFYGKEFVMIDRFFPSSKLCSTCGYIKDDLTLDIRDWNCPICNTVHDRDQNAALNILAEGHSVRGGNVSLGTQVDSSIFCRNANHLETTSFC